MVQCPNCMREFATRKGLNAHLGARGLCEGETYINAIDPVDGPRTGEIL